MEAAILMISRSGDILEILISMYLSTSYVRSASYQHKTTDTNKVQHMKLSENFKKFNKKECTPHAPLRSTSTCCDLYTQEVVKIESPPFLKGVTPIRYCYKTTDMNLGDTTFFLNNKIHIYLNIWIILYMSNKIYIHNITTLFVLKNWYCCNYIPWYL